MKLARKSGARSLKFRHRNLVRQSLCGAMFVAAAVSCIQPAVARELEERFMTGPMARLDLSNISGEIWVEGWDEEEILLTGSLDDNAEVELRHNDKRVGIKVVKKKGVRRMGGSDLHVRVPTASELSVYAVSSDLEVKAVTGSLRLEVVSGDINVFGFERDLEVKSVSGDIELRGSLKPGRVSVVSVSGDTDIREVAGELETTSISGDTQIVGGDFDRVRVKSTSGKVEFLGGLNSSGRLDAEAISGNVVINLVGEDELDVEVETFSGNIGNCLGEKSVRKSKFMPGQLLHFSRGAANRDVRVRSMSGNVEFCAR